MVDVERDWTSDRCLSLKDKLLFYKQIAAYRFACGYAKDKIALDIGCGSGYGADLLSKYARHVTAFDSNADVLRYCEERYKRRNLVFTAKTGGRFDVVTSMQVIEHQKDPHQFLQVCRNATVDVCVISTPNAALRWLNRRERPWNPDHAREYYADEFEALLKAHFPSVQMCGVHGSSDATIMERLRCSQRHDAVVDVNRTEDDWDCNDFTVGPAEGSLDLVGVCRCV